MIVLWWGIAACVTIVGAALTLYARSGGGISAGKWELVEWVLLGSVGCALASLCPARKLGVSRVFVGVVGIGVVYVFSFLEMLEQVGVSRDSGGAVWYAWGILMPSVAGAQAGVLAAGFSGEKHSRTVGSIKGLALAHVATMSTVGVLGWAAGHGGLIWGLSKGQGPVGVLLWVDGGTSIMLLVASGNVAVRKLALVGFAGGVAWRTIAPVLETISLGWDAYVVLAIGLVWKLHVVLRLLVVAVVAEACIVIQREKPMDDTSVQPGDNRVS